MNLTFYNEFSEYFRKIQNSKMYYRIKLTIFTWECSLAQKNMIQLIKRCRLKWFGSVKRIKGREIAYKRPNTRKQVGIPTERCLDGIGRGVNLHIDGGTKNDIHK